MSQSLAMFNQMGSDVFSSSMAQVAPYFATIDPEITELKPRFCQLMLKNQKKYTTI